MYKYQMEIWRFKRSGKYYDTIEFNTNSEFMFEISEEFDEIYNYKSNEFYYVITGKLVNQDTSSDTWNTHPNGFPILKIWR